jgi:CMP-N-acetylneuraminic acid synthetase
MKNIAIIPIRENSKRFPGKNFFTIANDPLYGLVAKVALKSKVFDSVFVGVENPELINDYCNDNHISLFKRSKESAYDTAQTEEVLLEFIKSEMLHDDDWVTVIQATCPFQSVDYFQKLDQEIKKDKYKSVITRIKFNRFFIDEVIAPDFIRSRTQDIDEKYLETGLFWSFNVKSFLKVNNRVINPVGFVDIKPGDDSDIDYKNDLDLILSRLKKEFSEAQ